jgi:hypothetical protein
MRQRNAAIQTKESSILLGQMPHLLVERAPIRSERRQVPHRCVSALWHDVYIPSKPHPHLLQQAMLYRWKGGGKMSNEQRIARFRAAVSTFKKWRENDFINDNDFGFIVTIAAEKYGVSSTSIYRDYNLTYPSKRVIDSNAAKSGEIKE